MEVELKKVKINKSIIGQCLPASFMQMINGDILGYVVIGSDKKTKVLIYDGVSKQLVLGIHYKKIELIKEYEQIDADGTRGEVFRIKPILFSGSYCPIKYNTNEETEENYNKLIKYKRKTDIAGQIYY